MIQYGALKTLGLLAWVSLYAWYTHGQSATPKGKKRREGEGESGERERVGRGREWGEGEGEWGEGEGEGGGEGESGERERESGERERESGERGEGEGEWGEGEERERESGENERECLDVQMSLVKVVHAVMIFMACHMFSCRLFRQGASELFQRCPGTPLRGTRGRLHL